MIDDVRDLSATEKRKEIARRNFFSYFGKCFVMTIVAAVCVALFSLFILGDFLKEFGADRAVFTSMRFVGIYLIFVLFMLGMYRFSNDEKARARDYHLALILIIIAVCASLATSKLLNVYAMPIALATYVLIELLGKKVSILSTAVIASVMLLVYATATPVGGGEGQYDLSIVIASVVCNTLSSVMITFFEHKHYSRLRFLITTLLVPLCVQPLVAIITLETAAPSLDILWNVVWCYGANVAAALVFMPLVAIFEGIFNIADDFRLNELCNLSNPLLKRLASEAPGTFNHSIVVGNLAEACATAIGENPNMARCAAYYHDVGKLKAPVYFSENQSSYNPHDELIPEVSVSMITSHTLFGEILAKQNRLPHEIVEICRQHHGTSPVGYFYRKALTLKEEGDIAVDKYTYAGPKPQTKIAAIIMIADTIEAAMRAYMPNTKEEFESRINKLVDEKLELHQFDECPITLSDIATIKRTIIEVLPSIHHSRVSYDKKAKTNTFNK